MIQTLDRGYQPLTRHTSTTYNVTAAIRAVETDNLLKIIRDQWSSVLVKMVINQSIQQNKKCERRESVAENLRSTTVELKQMQKFRHSMQNQIL